MSEMKAPPVGLTVWASKKLLVNDGHGEDRSWFKSDGDTYTDFSAGPVSMQAMADALIEIAVMNGPRAPGYPGCEMEEYVGYDPVAWAKEAEENPDLVDDCEDEGDLATYEASEAYCIAARALGIL